MPAFVKIAASFSKNTTVSELSGNRLGLDFKFMFKKRKKVKNPITTI